MTNPLQEEPETQLTLAVRLQRLRLQQGLSIQTLARLSDCSPTFITFLEKGLQVPNPKTAHLMFEALEMPLAERKVFVAVWGEKAKSVAEAWGLVGKGRMK